MTRGSEGAGRTDEAIADAWDVSAGSVGCRRAKRSFCSGGGGYAAGQPGAGNIVGTGPRTGGAGDCDPHPLRDFALHTKKRTDALASGSVLLSAGTHGGLRGPEKQCGISIASPTMRAIRYSAWTNNTKLLAEKQMPQPARPGRPATYDYELHAVRLVVRGAAGPVRHGPTPLSGTRPWTGHARCRPSRIIRATAKPSA